MKIESIQTPAEARCELPAVLSANDEHGTVLVSHASFECRFWCQRRMSVWFCHPRSLTNVADFLLN